MTVTSRGISFIQSLNNPPSNPSNCVDSEIKSVPEEKYNEKLNTGIGDNYSYSLLVIDDDLNVDDISCGNCSLNNHILPQNYCS